ncbi:MAG TPA: DUF222 domain-containing protein [Actinopolymorphaceae bacterium]|jgi:hypothetical protein
MTTTGTTPAAGVDHPVAHALVDALGLLRPVADPAEIRLWQLGDDQCLTTMLTVQHVESVVAAIKLQLLGVMEERQVTQHTTNLGTATWLNGTASSLNAAYRETGLARGLHRRFPAILTAMAAGSVSAEQAAAIVGVLKKLPADLDADQVKRAEKTMIGFAETYGPKGLRDIARYLLEVIAPEIAEQADAAQLEAQEREARKNQYLRLRDDGDGCVTIAGKLPAADGEALRAVVDAIAKSGTGTDDGSWAEPSLSYEAKRAQALMTLVHAYSASGQAPRHGGDRPRVVVLVNYEDLLRGVGGATLLASNTRISSGEARRLACDADILPAVLGSDSQLLDLGRTTRLFAGDLRQAIVVRDRGCVFPGCHREPRDCDAHHIRPWTANGPTSLDNGALVCPTHHRLVEPDPHADRATEHERWHMRMSQDGIPEVIPPSRDNEHRQPQRHKRFLKPQRR